MNNTILKRDGARRRVQMRSALFMYMAAFVLLRLSSFFLLPALPAGLMVNPLVQPLIQAAVSLVCIGLPASAGLFWIDGSHPELLCMQQLSTDAFVPLTLCGALALCPISLMRDMGLSVLGRFMPLVEQAGTALPPIAFLPNLLSAVLIAPLVEEIFFRGYLMGVFAGEGRKEAVLLSAVLFALLHSTAHSMSGYMLLGLILGMVVMHTGSLMAAVVIHAAYNLTTLLASGTGLSWIFSGLSFVSTALRMLGTVALVYCIRWAWRVERPKRRTAFFDLHLTAKEGKRILAAVLACCLLIGASWLVNRPEIYDKPLKTAQKKMKEAGEHVGIAIKQFLAQELGISWRD